MVNGLRELRATRSWSQLDLAIEAGASRQAINATEAGTCAAHRQARWLAPVG
jgi:DNA-binding XRE family transcriptional regulator